MFLCALVAVPFVALAACSTAVGRESFKEPSEDDNAAGAQTGRADADGGPSISASDAEVTPPAAPGSEIDLSAVEACDQDLDVDGNVDAFLKAIGLCKRAEKDGEEWGVIDAKFTTKLGSNSTNNDAGQHGILPKFGDILTPREGDRLGVLSTGWAREYNSSNGTSGNFTSGQDWSGGFGQDENDVIVLKLKIRVPMNAKSFSFDFNFHSAEWPNFVGSDFNDEFRVELDGDNISFDGDGNAVTVNTGFFDRCTPGVSLRGGLSGTSVCTGGPDELDGTGFGANGASRTQGGATGWLTTSAPVEPGSIIDLEFAIWDVQDQSYDSLVLVDNFKWDADAVTTGTKRPVN